VRLTLGWMQASHLTDPVGVIGTIGRNPRDTFAEPKPDGNLDLGKIIFDSSHQLNRVDPADELEICRLQVVEDTVVIRRLLGRSLEFACVQYTRDVITLRAVRQSPAFN